MIKNIELIKKILAENIVPNKQYIIKLSNNMIKVYESYASNKMSGLQPLKALETLWLPNGDCYEEVKEKFNVDLVLEESGIIDNMLKANNYEVELMKNNKNKLVWIILSIKERNNNTFETTTNLFNNSNKIVENTKIKSYIEKTINEEIINQLSRKKNTLNMITEKLNGIENKTEKVYKELKNKLGTNKIFYNKKNNLVIMDSFKVHAQKALSHLKDIWTNYFDDNDNIEIKVLRSGYKNNAETTKEKSIINSPSDGIVWIEINVK